MRRWLRAHPPEVTRVKPEDLDWDGEFVSDTGKLHGVPPLPRGYTPRDKAMRQLQQRLGDLDKLQTPAPPLALTGFGGAGKSTLANAFARYAVQRKKNPYRSVWWVSVANDEEFIGGLRQLAKDIGMPNAWDAPAQEVENHVRRRFNPPRPGWWCWTTPRATPRRCIAIKTCCGCARAATCW